MGKYLNRGNSGFTKIAKKDYRDKTGLIAVINSTIDTSLCLTCISRPRRFGKSYAAQMLCAYYDHTCDSHALFDGRAISKDKSYETFINKFDVIYLDIAALISNMNNKKVPISEIASTIKAVVREELVATYDYLDEIPDASDCILKCVSENNRKFIFIIDEWDAVIREAKNDTEAQEAYLDLLREWFKNGNFTDVAVAAAYMTGILPIKKDGSESAVSDFEEYSVLDPGEFAAFTGFTEEDVKDICAEKQMDFSKFKEWYDGYSFGTETSVYNPYSVMKAVNRKTFQSYWRKTSAAEALLTYVSIGGDELQAKIAALIAGEEVSVYTDDFENDVQSFKSDDDILTLLIHLGYLSYDVSTSMARVPNEEVRNEFRRLLKKAPRGKLIELIRNSEQLLKDTLACNGDAVAAEIERVRGMNYTPMHYNDEQALRYNVKFAYLVCADHYLKIEELPSGRGIADIVYLPIQGERYPALVIELKWDKSEESALEQIKANHYPAILDGYFGDILLVGIDYSTKSKKHICKIETINKK